MPRTKLGDKYSKPKIPPPNYLSEMLKRYKKAQKISDDTLAQKLGTSRQTVSTRLNQEPDAWNVGDLRKYCGLLGVPFEDALAAIGGGTR